MFQQVVDMFLLELLDCALNKIPESDRKLKSTTESQVNMYLAKAKYETVSKYPINIPPVHTIVSHTPAALKSEVHVLPLSLEDNSTIVGTMAILDQLASDFSLLNRKKCNEYVPFDIVSKTWDIKMARNLYELILSQQNHKKCMELLQNQLHAKYQEATCTNENVLDEDSQVEFAGIPVSTTLESERRQFGSEDKQFWDTYNMFCSTLLGICTSNSEERYVHFVNNCEKRDIEM